MPMRVVHSAPAAPDARLLIPRDRLLRLPSVEAIAGIKKSTIYTLMREGKFPQCIAITGRMVAWPETTVLQWVQDRINEARAGQPVEVRS